jgi:hypothetical protein
MNEPMVVARVRYMSYMNYMTDAILGRQRLGRSYRQGPLGIASSVSLYSILLWGTRAGSLQAHAPDTSMLT